MNELCMIIKKAVKPNFLNIRTSIRTYDRDALCCGAPCWRWVYHALHSADKWFINPCQYEEPSFHTEGMDNPTSVILSDRQLLDYLDAIEKKTMDYLDTLTDEMLYEKPEGCRYTRLELVLRQFRHISFHTGMLTARPPWPPGSFPCGFPKRRNMWMTGSCSADTGRARSARIPDSIKISPDCRKSGDLFLMEVLHDLPDHFRGLGCRGSAADLAGFQVPVRFIVQF